MAARRAPDKANRRGFRPATEALEMFRSAGGVYTRGGATLDNNVRGYALQRAVLHRKNALL